MGRPRQVPDRQQGRSAHQGWCSCMIGRLTLGVVMSDEDAQDVHAYAQVGLRVMQEHNPRHRIARGLVLLDKIICEMHGHETRALVPVVSESTPSSIDDLPPVVSVR